MHPETTRRAAHTVGWTLVGGVWLVTGTVGGSIALARNPVSLGGEWWSDTKSAETGYFRVRSVRFDVGGRVVEKVAEVHSD